MTQTRHNPKLTCLTPRRAKRPAVKAASRGFTIMELMLAIMISSVIAVTLYTSLSAARRVRADALAKVQRQGEAIRALDVMRRDLQSASPPTGILAERFLGEDAGEKDTLAFTTTNPLWPTSDRLGDMVRVTYRLESMSIDPDSEEGMQQIEIGNTDEGGPYRLVRAVTSRPLAQTPVAEVQPLLNNVTGWDVQYSRGSTWSDGYNSSSYQDQLPAGVRITIRMQGADESDTEASQELTVSYAMPGGLRYNRGITDGGG